MTMTPRQRWLALLEGKPADRIPTDYQATDEVTARLLKDLGCNDEESLWRKLHIDCRKFVEPVWRRPDDCEDPKNVFEMAYRPPKGATAGLSSSVSWGDPFRTAGQASSGTLFKTRSKADMWGIRYRSVDYGTGAYDEPEFMPLANVGSVEEVHAHRWPDPDEFDYGPITRAVESADGYRPIHASCYEPFLLYGYLRGLETAFADLALQPEIAEAILGHILDFYHEHHRRIFEAGVGRIDLTFVAEDLGAQTGPLMSLPMYRRFLLPGQIKMAELARSHGVHVMYHTDGAARVFIPDLIERVGIEILNPIQWRCPGMEREALVADFGEKIIFHGSIDNQQTLAFGTVDDVVAEVRQSVEIYKDARWICAPCHNIQPVSSTENIVAMYETIHEIGRR